VAAHPDPRGELSFRAFSRRLHGLQNRIQKITLRQRAFKSMLLVDDRLGNGLDTVLANKIGKFSGLNAISRDVLALHCELVGQANRPWAMRSRGSDKDLKVNRLAQVRKLLFAACTQARFTL
jgi:hypothetical protein